MNSHKMHPINALVYICALTAVETSTINDYVIFEARMAILCSSQSIHPQHGQYNIKTLKNLPHL